MACPQGRYISPVLPVSCCFIMPIVVAGEGAWTTFDRCISPARACHDCRQGVTSLPVRRCISPRKCCFFLLKQYFRRPPCSLPVLPVTLLGSTAAFKSPERNRAPEEEGAQDGPHARTGPEPHRPISCANRPQQQRHPDLENIQGVREIPQRCALDALSTRRPVRWSPSRPARCDHPA